MDSQSSLYSSPARCSAPGRWQINGRFSSYGGRPFTVSADGGTLNAPGNSQTAEQVNPAVRKIGSLGQFFDKPAFAAIRDARFGNTGRNILRGPGVVDLNPGLFRDFKPRERLQPQFRAEAFNATNTPHFNNPQANVSSATFMQITSARTDQRTVRLGMRVV